MRNSVIVLLVIAVTLLMAAAFVQADNRTSTTVDVTGTVIESLQLEVIADLDFGVFTAPSSGTTTYEIFPFGGSSSSASQFWSGSYHRAECSVIGQPDYLYHVKIDTEEVRYDICTTAVETTLTGPDSETLIVDRYRVNSANGPGFLSLFKLDNSGLDTLWIGATLTVPANKPAGYYSGSFELTVFYL